MQTSDHIFVKTKSNVLTSEAFTTFIAEKGAAAHHHVEIVSVRVYKVNPCLGCRNFS
jgi:hypothetical protein